MTTLITESNIQPGSVTANIFSVGVTLGGGGVTISNVIVTDSQFNSTGVPTIPATGNDDYGWFGGGGDTPQSISRVDRIDFAADTATAAIRGPLSLGRTQFGATSGSA